MASNSSPDSLRPTSPTSPPPPIDLRHMTSNPGLNSPTRDLRHGSKSQHLRTADPRLGSPTSIPSSPTSVRSSSSAIFERDIEPIVPPSPPSTHHHPPNPHRVPRAKGSEQLEQSVPSVLDSAASILASVEPDDLAGEVAVVSPAASAFESMVGRTSGFTSPIGSFRSRSPSPIGSRVTSGQTRGDVVLSIPVSPQSPIASPTSVLGLHNLPPPALSPAAPSSVASSPGSAMRPTIQTTSTQTTVTQLLVSGGNSGGGSATTPSIITPTSAYYSVESEGQSPTTTTAEQPPPSALTSPAPAPPSPSARNASPLQPPTSLASPMTSSSPSAAPPTLPISPSTTSHPPSPIHVAKKRLSFMSYSDLLSSTPSSTQPLSSLTTCASSSEPPPHIPGVSGLNVVSALASAANGTIISGGSKAPSLHGYPVVSSATGGITHPGKRDSISLLDNVGGEWEREGLGMGMEERLDALLIPPPGGSTSVAGSVAGVPLIQVPQPQVVGGKA